MRRLVMMTFAGIIPFALIIICGISASSNTKYYEISESSAGEYKYTIFNRKGEIVCSDIAYRIEPNIFIIDNELIWIEVSIGTATTQTKFYNLNDNCMSNWFDTPRAAKNNLVVLMDWNAEGRAVIAVKEIFSGNVKCTIEREFSPIANLGGILLEAEFLSENKIRVNYLFGDDYMKVEEILPIK